MTQKNTRSNKKALPSSDLKVQIGNRLRVIRKSLEPKVNIDLMASMYGVERATWNYYELGKRAIPLDLIKNVAKSHNINLYWLIFGEGEMIASECTCHINHMKEDGANYNKIKELEEENERLKAALIKLATSPQN